MTENHSPVACSLCGVVKKSAKHLKGHQKTCIKRDPTGTEKPKINNLTPRGWNKSFPVDEETFYKMKAGEVEKTCPNCKKTFVNFQITFRHFSRNKCKKDQKIVEASPDMVTVIRNEGEKLK